MRKMSIGGRAKGWEENNAGLKPADPGERVAERKGKQKRNGQTGCVFTLDYFCGVASACSSCGYWIMQKFMSLSVSLCQPFSVCLHWRIANLLPVTALTEVEVLWVCIGQTDEQWTHWDLAAVALLHPPCSLCISNPLLCPSPWQSNTHVSASHSTYAHMHTSKLLLIIRGEAGGLITDWLRGKKAITADVTEA